MVEVDFDEYIKRGKEHEEQRQYSKVHGSEAKDAIYYSSSETIPEGKEVGDVRIPAVEAVEAVYVEGKSPEDVGKPDGGVALRKNYASIGYTYDEDKDVFIPS